jgi:hypothetical protein
VQIGQKELAAAFVTSAYIEISPKVEKIRDIVDMWVQVGQQLPITNQWDYIASILATGRIRDMNAQHIHAREDLGNIYGRIREQLTKLIGE